MDLDDLKTRYENVTGNDACPAVSAGELLYTGDFVRFVIARILIDKADEEIREKENPIVKYLKDHTETAHIVNRNVFLHWERWKNEGVWSVQTKKWNEFSFYTHIRTESEKKAVAWMEKLHE